MAGNKSLGAAKRAKEDEFYTQLSDIEKELRFYKQHFESKTVLCNCDDPRVSNFWKYFTLNFEALGLKRVIATCYKSNTPDLFSMHQCEQAVYQIYEGDKNGNRRVDPEEIDVLPLHGDGDFRSNECIELLKQADIVCTNPPFSLFREYLAQLIKYEKKFLIIGNQNAIHYKEVFPLIKANKLWIGISLGAKEYLKPDGSTIKMGNTIWYTNLEHFRRHEELVLYKRFNPSDYLHYDNFKGIDVPEISEIPCDYDGIMGVPDTILAQLNPNQFEIVGLGSGNLAKEVGVEKNYRGRTDLAYTTKEGIHKCPYSRILIRRK